MNEKKKPKKTSKPRLFWWNQYKSWELRMTGSEETSARAEDSQLIFVYEVF